MLLNNDAVYEVTGLQSNERQRIADFIQGAVYCWTKNRPDEAFALRDLFGGENTLWTDTPLQVLYDRHISLGKSSDDAHEQAGKDAGWLLKKVLAEDTRAFSCSKAALVNLYTWVP